MGGLVVLVTTGKNPINTYRAIFDGSGSQLVLPDPLGYRLGRRVQPPADADRRRRRSILVGLAVAFAFRCGLFNIGGQGQYLAGAIMAVWIGSSFDGLSPFLHVLARARARHARWAALVAGIAGFLKATVGAHEVITTIMLNWIVLWVGVVPVRARRPAPERHAVVGSDLERRRRGREAPRLLGRPAPAGPPHRLLHRARRARRLLGDPQPHDARVRRPGGRLQPRGCPVRRHQRRAATTSSRWRSRARSPGSRARSTSSAGSSGSRRATSRPRPLGFTGHRRRAPRPQHGRGNVSPSALLFGALANGDVDAQPRPRRSSSPSSPST